MATKPYAQKISPFLWFDKQAEEAAKFYCSIFKNSKLIRSNPMTAEFELEGLNIMALNAGPQFKFNEAISLFVNCDTQQEVDELWDKLSIGGKKSRCGWLQDKYGLWWQIIPTTLGKLLYDKDPKKSKQVMDAMLKMDKIIIKDLEAAYGK